MRFHELVKGIVFDLVESKWDFDFVSEKYSLPIYKIKALIRDEETLANTYSNIMFREEREKFKNLWQRYLDFTGYIYFVKAKGEKAVKIGYSKAPFNRVKDLNTGSFVDLEVYYIMLGNTAIEALLHKRWEDDNLRGEWFDFTNEIETYIVQLSNHTAMKGILAI